MAYIQNLMGCYEGTADKAALHPYLHSNALQTFQNAYHGGKLAPLALVEQTEDLKSYQEQAAFFKAYDDILILGTGGSSLGGKSLYALSKQGKPHLHFLDNIDPTTFNSLFNRLDANKTSILAISKSGSTVETLMQLLLCLEHFGNNGQFMIITEPTANPIRQLAETHSWPCLDHPTDVGGRYSCFSVVGLLPMILAGLDVHDFRKGARDVLGQTLTSEVSPPLEGAAMAVYLETHHNKTLSVMMPYADQLDSFSLWYRQLWAESVGKNGKGTTPIKALGTVDQHSQLQLYLDGPKDKFFTLLTTQWDRVGTPIKSHIIPDFTGKTMGDLFAAEQKATYQTLIRNNCPTRLITLDLIDEYHMGALMMHFMIETILTSYLIKVNAFDQPAVEEGKRLAREYLAA